MSRVCQSNAASVSSGYEDALAAAQEASVATGDQVCVIDNDLRTISVPEGMILGVEKDKDVTEVHFRGPRYHGGTDLSTMTAKVNIINAIGEQDCYIVQDLTVEEDSIEFIWVVGRNAMASDGVVTFSLTFRAVDTEGVVLKEFNTCPVAVPVLAGIECGAGPDEIVRDTLVQVTQTIVSIEGQIASLLERVAALEGNGSQEVS